MHSLTHMSLNLDFQMFPSVSELQSMVMKKQLGNAGLQGQAKQHRAPRTGPSMLLALFHVINALDTVFKEH